MRKLLASFMLLFTVVCFSQDYRNLNIQQYQKIILEDNSLMSGNLGIYRLNDKSVVLISVGSAMLSKAGGSTSMAQRIAEVVARSKVVQFIQGVSIKTRTEVTKIRITKKTDSRVLKEFKKKVRTYTEEKAKGFVKGMKIVGTWESTEGHELYVAIARVFQIN